MNRILYTNEDGSLSIVIPVAGLDEAISRIPSGTQYEVVAIEQIPFDRTFRNAWEQDPSAKVKTNLSKAKLISHEIRRSQRDELFKPLDIQATIPSQASQAEASRQEIRDADAIRQTAIDSATTEAELKTILGI